MKKLLALLLSLLMLISSCPALAEGEIDWSEPWELTYVGWACGEIEDENFCELLLEEKFNVEIKVSRIDLSNGEQRNLMLASGEMPECGWAIDSAPKLYTQQGLTRLIPEEMIRQYAPMYAAYLDEQPIGWQYNKDPETGNLMGLIGRTTNNPKGIVSVRLDWLENLGLPIPEYTAMDGLEGSIYENKIFKTDYQYTADEMYEVLKAFTYNDPDGNGVKDTFGLALNSSGSGFEWSPLWNMFSLSGNASWTYNFPAEDGLCDLYFTTENYKAFLTYVAKLYAEGLVDQEYVAVSTTACREKYNIGQAGMAFAVSTWSPFRFDNRPHCGPITMGQEGAKLLIMPVPTANDGTFAIQNNSVTNYSTDFVVRADVSDEKLAKILAMFDYINLDPEAQILYRVGQENVHFVWNDPENKTGGYVYTENGYLGKDLGIFSFSGNYVQTPISHNLMNDRYASASADFFQSVYEGHILEPYKLNLFESENSEQYRELTDLYTTSVKTAVVEYMTSVITGEVKLEETWDAYIADLYDLGYGELRIAYGSLPTFEQFVAGDY